MTRNLTQEICRRVVLARGLYKEAELASAKRNDPISFTKGILLLHDSAELMLVAVADHLGADVRAKDTLLDYYERIKAADCQHRTLPCRAEISRLNALRNSAKHKGIFPDMKSNGYLVSVVRGLLEYMCETYLEAQFSSISLRTLIRDEKVRQYIDEAEAHLETRQIEEALISLAFAMYCLCELPAVPWYLGSEPDSMGKQAPMLRPEVYSMQHIVRLIERGVDPYLYHRFKNLTPMIVQDRETGQLSYQWDKLYGHPVNWTVDNVRFCLDFCVDAALKFQRDEEEGYTLVPYYEVYEDVVEPVGEQAIVWDRPFRPLTPLLAENPPVRRQLLVIRKGYPVIGWAWDTTSSVGSEEWLLVSSAIPPALGPINAGFISRQEVTVTSRPRSAGEEPE